MMLHILNYLSLSIYYFCVYVFTYYNYNDEMRKAQAAPALLVKLHQGGLAIEA